MGTGRAAVEAWRRGRHDLILMDVQMPDMDGLEATQEIRRQESLLGSHVPIYGVTAYAMSGDREVCLVAGMDGYIAKPVEFAALRNMVMGVAGQKNSGQDVQAGC